MPLFYGAIFLTLHLYFILCVLVWNVESASKGITSNFVRSEWPSVDIPLENEVFAIPIGHNAPQQVHITQGDYDGNAVIISWITADSPGSSVVHYGKLKHKLDFSANGTFKRYTFYNYTSGFIHNCLVRDLEYNRKYFYQIGEGNATRGFWFNSPAEIGPDSPITFAIIGDLGQTYNSLSTLQHLMQSKAETVLFVGDLSYSDSYEYDDVSIRWDTWGRLIEPSAAYLPWIWTAGNHEIEFMPKMGETVPFKAYLNRFSTPYRACRSSSSLWHAVRRASAHIIVLSSYSSFVKYSPQWRWFQEELQRVDREKTPWLIVLMHAPMYSSNIAHYMEGESFRAAYEEWFLQYKVDLVFAGHVHAYERSFRISNVRENTTSPCVAVPDNSAPVYITVGDGGNREGLAEKYLDPQPHYSAFREASYGHSTLELKNRTHAVYHWNRNNDGDKVKTDSVVFLNQYWSWNRRRRRTV